MLTNVRRAAFPLSLALVWTFSSGCSAGSGGADSNTAQGTGGAVSGGASGSGATSSGASASVGGSSTGGAASGGAPGSGGASAGTELVRADFDATAVGPYTNALVAGDFGAAPSWNDGLDEGRAAVVEESGNRFLRVTYTGSQFGPGDGGVQFKIPLGQSYEELYLSYRVRFASGFEFVKGGKLPGLVGGTAPTGCVDDTGGFSARMMWRTGGAAVQYMYFPEKVNACGDDFEYLGGGQPAHFAPGTWHTVEHRIVMNAEGQHDGVLQAWFDGELALSDAAFSYRVTGATFGIDALYFSTFFGGGDATWAPSADQIADFDDFVISTSKIGQ